MLDWIILAVLLGMIAGLLIASPVARIVAIDSFRHPFRESVVELDENGRVHVTPADDDRPISLA